MGLRFTNYKQCTSFAEYVWYYFLIFHFKYIICLLVFLLEDTFSVSTIKYRATKSIPEIFQSASPQIWKCCFVSDFEMFDVFSLLLRRDNKNFKFQT